MSILAGVVLALVGMGVAWFGFTEGSQRAAHLAIGVGVCMMMGGALWVGERL